MELDEQDVPPDFLQFLVRVGQAPRYQCGGGPQLRLAHQVLTAAVPLLDLDLARERPAVQLEVKLARPHGRVNVLGVGSFKKLRRRLDYDLR